MRAGIDPVDVFVVGFMRTDSFILGTLVIIISPSMFSSATGISGSCPSTASLATPLDELEESFLFRRLRQGNVHRLRFGGGLNAVARGEMRRMGIVSSAATSMICSSETGRDRFEPQKLQQFLLVVELVVELDVGEGALYLLPLVPSSCRSMVRMIYRFREMVRKLRIGGEDAE